MKPSLLPSFREGHEYRQLHPTKEGGKRWRFVTCKGIRLPHGGIEDGRVIMYHDATGKVWAHHDKFGSYVHEGYAWNGCSPKRWVWPFGWMGTPDLHCTRLASLFHDIGYQFCRTEHFPFHKSDIDLLFFNIISMTGNDDIARVYYEAVRNFGRWSDKPCNGEFSTLL